MILRVLNIFSYLMKAGNIEFVDDVRKNIDLLQSLQKVDTHYFQNTHPKNIKKLEYNLEAIRQLAKHLEILVDNETVLESERKKSTKKIERFISRLDNTE